MEVDYTYACGATDLDCAEMAIPNFFVKAAPTHSGRFDHLCNREGESFQRSSVLSQLFHSYPPQYYAVHRCTYQWRKKC